MKRFFKQAEGRFRTIRDNVLRNNDTDSDNDLVITMPEPYINVYKPTSGTIKLNEIQEKLKNALARNLELTKQNNDIHSQPIPNKLDIGAVKSLDTSVAPEVLVSQTTSNQVELKLEARKTVHQIVDKQPELASTITTNVDEDIDIILPDCFNLSKPYGNFAVLPHVDYTIETLGSLANDDTI